MNYNFEKKSLKEVTIHIFRGITPSYDEKGVNVVNQKCIRNKKLDLDQCRITNPEKRKIKQDKYLQRYDVLVNSTGVGTLGRVAQIKDELNKPLTADSHVTIVRPNLKLVDGLYFGYAMINNEHNITNLAEGSTGQTELSRKRLNSEINIFLPSFQIQRKIADILLSLDRKIDLNHKMNQNLEEIGTAIFKLWFTHFEFPNDEGKPYNSSGGLMIDSELGKIPEKWETGILKNIISESKKKVDTTSSTYDVLSAVKTGNLVKSDDYFTKKVYSKDISKYKLVEKHDFAYNPARINIGSIGMLEEDIKGAVSPVYVVFKTSEDYQYFVSMFLKLKTTQTQINQFCSGTVRQTIDYNGFSKIQLIIPPKNIVKHYNMIYNSINSLIKHNNYNSYNLSQIRDSLLPKLMSGKIRVPLEEK